MIGVAMFTLLGAPPWFVLCWKAFRPYPSGAGLFVWSTRAPGYSTLVSGVFGGLAIIAAMGAAANYRLFLEIQQSEYHELQYLGIYMALVSIGWATMWLSLRSCLIAKRVNQA